MFLHKGGFLDETDTLSRVFCSSASSGIQLLVANVRISKGYHPLLKAKLHEKAAERMLNWLKREGFPGYEREEDVVMADAEGGGQAGKGKGKRRSTSGGGGSSGSQAKRGRKGK